MNTHTENELTLHAAPCGQLVELVRIDAESGTARRLGEIGFCRQRVIRKLAQPDALICQICNSRVGLSAKLAKRIYVRSVSQPAGENLR